MTRPAPDGAASRVSAGRLAGDLDALGRIGRDDDGAVNRVCFTPAEEEAHGLVAGWMEDLGLDVSRDGFGNTVGTRPGRGGSGRAIAIGSHVDSVPRGGNYDGAVGVVGAIEAARALAEEGRVLVHDLRVVCFSAEEGARFGAPCLGSKAALGLLGPDDAQRLEDGRGVTLAEALEARGSSVEALGVADWVEGLDAFVELHIEQGRVLEDARQPIGVVDWIAGNRRLRMTLRGQTDHSGATPMPIRRDALVAAAAVVGDVDRLARRTRGLVGTVGEFTVHPNALTAVPGKVELSVDVRSADVVVQEETIEAVMEAAARHCAARGVDLEVDDVSSVAPVMLPSWLRRSLTDVARRFTPRPRVMTSGAGHDAAIMARRVPAGMVFIPCRGGVSHSPEEWASTDQIALGTQVLTAGVVELDGMLAGAGGRP